MTKIRFLMLSIFTISLLLVSCGKTIDESLVLAEYLESADSPIDAAAIQKYITAADLQALNATQGAYIIDVRSATDFSTIGHIAGAVNVSAADVISHLKSKDVSGYDKIVIACYTGQTAGYVTSLVRLAGYNAFSLKWGMASWNEACAGKLNNNMNNTYATQLEITANTKAEKGSMPVLETELKTGSEILDAQVATVMADGFGAAAVTAAEVFGNLSNYYIVNYWPENHYNLGHIPGAIQYTPGTDLLTTSFLKTLPADKTVVVYCYTGQTSAFMAAYLNVLGYDAKTLKFGMNGMAHDWAAGKSLPHWSESNIAGYDLVTE